MHRHVCCQQPQIKHEGQVSMLLLAMAWALLSANIAGNCSSSCNAHACTRNLKTRSTRTHVHAGDVQVMSPRIEMLGLHPAASTFCISGKPAGNASELAKHKPAGLVTCTWSDLRSLSTHTFPHAQSPLLHQRWPTAAGCLYPLPIS